MSFVFENRDTVLFQIQEMVRAERIVDEKKIQDEIDVYKELIPGEGELSATMFIEIQDQSRIRATLESFLGLTRPGVVYLAIEDDIRVDAGIWKARRPFCQEPGKGRRVLLLSPESNYPRSRTSWNAKMCGDEAQTRVSTEPAGPQTSFDEVKSLVDEAVREGRSRPRTRADSGRKR